LLLPVWFPLHVDPVPPYLSTVSTEIGRGFDQLALDPPSLDRPADWESAGWSTQKVPINPDSWPSPGTLGG